MDWSDKTFKNVWFTITWNEPLQKSYVELLQFFEIARCQCISIATCERIFLVQTVINIQYKNHLNTKHLDYLTRFTLEVPKENFDHILMKAIELWRNAAK